MSPCAGARRVPAHEGLAALALAPGAVDIWVARVDEVFDSGLAPRLAQVVSEEELQRQARFLFEKDRRRYLVTRALVRYVLSRYVPLAPRQWRFGATAHGRPFILNADPLLEGLSFNISHSGQVVLLALGRGGQLGVDVEETGRTTALDVADSVFSARELLQLRALPQAEQAQRFLQFWTLKESYIKARGMGLSLPLQKFGFELGSGQQLRAHIDADLDDVPGNWAFWQWTPGPDSIGALCVQRRPGVAHRVAVRRTVPFAWEESASFDVLRTSSL